jgi:hypothetical protein
MKPVFYTLSLFFLSACKHPIDVAYIKSTGWSYADGYRVTDFMNFDQGTGYIIKGDTIFFEDKPRALIVVLDKKAFDLTIESLDGKRVGHYMDEREMFH